MSKLSKFELALITIGLSTCFKKKKTRRWAKEWFKRRGKYGHQFLLKELRTEPNDYKNFLRMDEESFNCLLHLVSPFIMKENTVMRESISPRERLSITLRYLATGATFEDLKFSTFTSPTTISGIVMETCKALCICLKDYIKMPNTSLGWKNIAHGFNERWNFPHCLGAVDGKHVNMTKPPNSGSFYYNYKGTFSVVLLAVVNSNYEFIMADVGINGRVSDGGVLGYTKFGEMLAENNLGIPDAEVLPNFQKPLPYVFVGDDAFAMSENLLKPYSGADLTLEKRIFNYRLSRARRIVENVFGILASRFGVFQRPFLLGPEKVKIIVLACCYLHNFLRRKNSHEYMPRGSVDFENEQAGVTLPGSWRSDNTEIIKLRNMNKNSTERAKLNRDNYSEFFNGVGNVSWQNKFTY